eukprot:104567-Pelagomonas_calceolata.AAC.1
MDVPLFWKDLTKAILREDKSNFGLGCPSIAIEYHARCAAALTTSLNNSVLTPCLPVTKSLLESQIHQRRNHTLRNNNPSHQTSSFILKQLP